MVNDTSKPAAKTEAPPPAEVENDVDDIFEDAEFVTLADDNDKETVRRDARRKIEIYWEKRRLKEQFDDFDESEFGF
jgi:hypothetical protein